MSLVHRHRVLGDRPVNVGTSTNSNMLSKEKLSTPSGIRSEQNPILPAHVNVKTVTATYLDENVSLPGTPMNEQHERQMEITRAKRELQAQQARLDDFEQLLARVKCECDEQVKVKKSKGFPTPLKLGTKSSAVTAFCESTPIEKLTRSRLCESNAMMRTPLSVPFTYAWDDDSYLVQPSFAGANDQGDYINLDRDAGEYCTIGPNDDSNSESEYVEVLGTQRDHEGDYVSIGPTTGIDGDVSSGSFDRVRASPGFAREEGDFMADENGGARSEIHVAAAKGDVKQVISLMVKGWDVNIKDRFGRSPLMYAMRYQQLPTAKWLLEHGGNINQQTKDHSTTLHYTAYQGTPAAVRFLLQHKANPRIPDNEGRTSVHWSMHNPDVKVLDMFLAEGGVTKADINGRDNTGMTPVMWACFYDSTEHLERMITLGADLTLVDVEGKNAMHWSVRSGKAKCLKRLLTYQNSFCMDNQGRSVVHHAAEVGAKKAIKCILSLRPQAVHDVDDNGRTPLHWAAVCRHPYAILSLVKHGAFVGRKDVHEKDALQYVKEHGFDEGITILEAAAKFSLADKPRLGPANASTSLRSFDLVTPQGVNDPSDAAQELFKMLSIGTYLGKFALLGKGALQKRYFWLDCYTGELCWARSPAHFARTPSAASSQYLSDVSDKPSEIIVSRTDYNPGAAHKFAFTLQTHGRRIDVVADNEQTYRMWIDGLRCLQVYGENILQSVNNV